MYELQQQQVFEALDGCWDGRRMAEMQTAVERLEADELERKYPPMSEEAKVEEARRVYEHGKYLERVKA